jgi:phospholipid/cholesterol/gamma-HCH transport system ATP-binding protein
MNAPAPILEFDGVTLFSGAFGQAGMRGLDLQLMPGDLALVRVEPGNESLPLADAAEGLIRADDGNIAFLGERWSEMGPDRELALRARIGRVFDGHGWISNLNVLENLTLSQRHHTLRPVPESIAEAQELARSFGLGEAPAVRPALASRRDLRRAEWVRAFLGQPALILLERPTIGVAVEHAPLLIRAVEIARARGAAVLWTHEEEDFCGEPGQKCLRFHMRGDMILADTGI